jgi:hypothetical protein
MIKIETAQIFGRKRETKQHNLTRLFILFHYLENRNTLFLFNDAKF